MSWETVKLGDIITTLKGYAFKSGRYVEKGCPIVRASNFTMDSISTDDLKYYSYEEAIEYEKYKLYTNDILIQTVGSWEYNPNSVVGKVVHVPFDVEGALLNQNIVKIIPEEIVDNIYLYYRLKCTDFGKHNIGNAVGAANQASITLDTIKAFTFDLPSMPEQKRIADILSNYDNLIENNQKQIKLLEEAAQRLYKEWFVDLHFPGYESATITDGVPEEWKKGRAQDFFEITIGKTPPRAESQWFVKSEEGVPWISISDMGNSNTFIFTTNESLTSDAIQKHNVKIIQKGTVLLSFKLTVGRVSITSTEMCTNEAIAHFKISDENTREYLYCYLKNFHYDSLGSTSSISKAINSKIVKAMPVVLPDDNLLEKFSKVVAPLFEQIFVKQKEVIKLTEARDRLLPKLMSGELML